MRLQKKVISTVIIIFLFINLTFLFTTIQLQISDANKKLENKIEHNTWLLNEVIGEPLYQYNTELVESLLNTMLNDSDIRSFHLIEKNKVFEIFLVNSHIDKEDVIEKRANIYHAGELIGEIITVYTRQNISTEVKLNIIRNITTLIIISFILSFILYFILKKIINPIKNLTSISIDISNGDLDKDIEVTSDDEIGILSESFIKMKNSIKEKISQLEIEIEDRKKAEKELAITNDQLELHKQSLEIIVDKRTSELKESLIKLKHTQEQLIETEKMASLGELVSGVAHEINTPVGIGLTASSYLKDRAEEMLTTMLSESDEKNGMYNVVKKCLESSEVLMSNMQKASEIIKSFKEIAIDNSNEDFRIINIKEYLDNIISKLAIKYEHFDTKITFECIEDIIIKTYPGALYRIISQLLKNTHMHGLKEGEIVTINITIKRKEESAELIYKDNGKGISEEDINKIFTPFYTTGRSKGGKGLGLNVVYNLVVHKLKGGISSESVLGQGLGFKIVIPSLK